MPPKDRGVMLQLTPFALQTHQAYKYRCEDEGWLQPMLMCFINMFRSRV